MSADSKQTDPVPPFTQATGYGSVLRRSHIEEAFGLAYWVLAVVAHSAGLPGWCVWPAAFFGCVNWAGSWYYARKEFAEEESHNRGLKQQNER